MSRDLRPTLVALVPRGWTPEQALRAVNLLQQAIAAIWVVHGQAMGRAVLDEPPPGRPDPPPLPRRPGGR